REFAAGWAGRLEIEVVDDGTESDETKLGAIGDLGLVIRERSLDDDLLVAAGDSIFEGARLEEFARLGLEKQAPVEAVYDVGDLEAVKRYSVITPDAGGRVIAFEEKPDEPQSTLAGIALYFYPRSTLPLIDRYLAEGNNSDQPGRLVEWMHTRTPVRYDDAVRSFVAAWKERELRRLAAAAASVVLEVVALPRGEAVTFVPPDPDRGLKRGHHPPRKLAEALAREWELPLVAPLR